MFYLEVKWSKFDPTKVYQKWSVYLRPSEGHNIAHNHLFITRQTNFIIPSNINSPQPQKQKTICDYSHAHWTLKALPV